MHICNFIQQDGFTMTYFEIEKITTIQTTLSKNGQLRKLTLSFNFKAIIDMVST